MSCWEGEAWRKTKIRGKRIIYSISIEICEIEAFDPGLTEVLKEKLAQPRVKITEPIYFGNLPFSIQVYEDNPSDDSWMNGLKS